MNTHTNPVYPYHPPPELAGAAAYRKVLIVGAGPVGLVAAIDLAQRDRPALVVDDNDTVSVGSRAVCYAKRTLEILDRLGCGQAIVERGVGWNTGQVFFGERKIYEFNLQTEAGHRRPAFINLQQYHLEELLLKHLAELGTADLRWLNK